MIKSFIKTIKVIGYIVLIPLIIVGILLAITSFYFYIPAAIFTGILIYEIIKRLFQIRSSSIRKHIKKLRAEKTEEFNEMADKIEDLLEHYLLLKEFKKVDAKAIIKKSNEHSETINTNLTKQIDAVSKL